MKHLLLAAGIYFTATAHPGKSSTISVPPATPAKPAGHIWIGPSPYFFINWVFVKVGLENEVSHIKWSTKEDNDIVRFEIEHSIDDKTFTLIGIVPAGGSNTEVNNYNWLHSPAPGLNYYKIKEVNRNKTYTYSEIVCLPYTKGLTKTLAIPNEVTGDLTLFFPEPTRQVTLNVYNAEGLSLINKTIPDSSTKEILDLSPYGKGVYFIYILSRNKTEIVRVVKNNVSFSVMPRRSFDRD